MDGGTPEGPTSDPYDTCPDSLTACSSPKSQFFGAEGAGSSSQPDASGQGRTDQTLAQIPASHPHSDTAMSNPSSSQWGTAQSSTPTPTPASHPEEASPDSQPAILPGNSRTADITTSTTTTSNLTSNPVSFSVPVQVSSSPGNSELCFAEGAEDCCYTDEAAYEECEESSATIAAPALSPAHTTTHTPTMTATTLTTTTPVQETREGRSRHHTSVIALEQGRYFPNVPLDQHAEEEVYVMRRLHHQGQQSPQQQESQSSVSVGASAVHGDGASVSPSGVVWSESHTASSFHSLSPLPPPPVLPSSSFSCPQQQQPCLRTERGPSWPSPVSSPSLPPPPPSHTMSDTGTQPPPSPSDQAYAGYRHSPSHTTLLPGTSLQHPPYSGGVGVGPSPSPSSPVQLPAITVHSARSLPPWVSSTPSIHLDLRRATNSSYAELRRRRATFGDDWLGNSDGYGHEHSGINAANMALSGFYMVDRAHRHIVRCFYCGLQLDNLTAAHNIWDEHVRNSPDCAYLNAVMGSDFVEETLRNLRDDLDHDLDRCDHDDDDDDQDHGPV